ncbi:MAG TPA: efflux transporter outer membrane subunit [Gammaproteobacteria bacterium]|jgi:NodT family efflux transporter outer membrane factor (OMF) lipoprotein
MQHVRTIASILTAAVLAAACAVGPEYETPAIDTGGGWAEAAATTEAELDLSRWWRRFDDAVLDRLVAQALEQNLDVRQATARVAEARALRAAAAGGRYPLVETSASVTRRRQSENGPLPIGQIPGLERDQTIYEPGFDALWELDLFGRTRRTVEAADARVEAAVERQRGAQMTVAAETARSYLALRGTQHELQARRAAVAATRSSAELVRMQFEAGQVPEAAVVQTEAELAAVEAGLPPLEAQVRTAALSIGILLGDLPEAGLALVDQAPEYAALAPYPVGERADLLRRRPDVRAAERALAAATAEVGVATAELFPKISIGAGGGFQSLEPGELFESDSQTWSVVPLISWRVFDGGRVRAQVDAAEARVELAALEYEQAVKQALTDAELALTRYDLGLDALERQDTAVAAARTSYGHATTRYRAGDISLLELLDAERVLRNAEDAYARIHARAATDLVALFKALGGGWEDAGRG